MTTDDARHIQNLISDGARPEDWTVEQETAMLNDVPGRGPAALTTEQVWRVVRVLRDMDLQQRITDEHGGRELAWFYWIGDVEQALGLDPGALSMNAWADRFTDG